MPGPEGADGNGANHGDRFGAACGEGAFIGWVAFGRKRRFGAFGRGFGAGKNRSSVTAPVGADAPNGSAIDGLAGAAGGAATAPGAKGKP